MGWTDRYWGKACPEQQHASHHLLCLHSLDVAAALTALLDARPAQLAALAARSDISVESCRALLTLCAALHDLGKFACAFQAKAADYWPHRARWKGPPGDPFGHGAYGTPLWKQLREEPSIARLGEGVSVWLDAAFAHHGRPIDQAAEATRLPDVMCEEAVADARNFARAMVERFARDACVSRDQALRVEFEIAGLISVADWIGSNQDWFPYVSAAVDIESYWADRCARAKQAEQAFGLVEEAPAAAVSLSDLIATTGPVEASPLQRAAASVPLADGAALYLLEDLTGAGKTEAALLLAHRLMRAGRAEGLYWALPTMATANGIFDRLGRAYRQLFEGDATPSLVLTHGGARDHEGFRRILTPSISTSQTYPEEASALCAEWLASDGRRALFAQVGIGTIDQALLAALPVKHQAVRSAALARRILVVDEAHAYDPYMTRGLERLLGRHLDGGGCAIVLSATLPLNLRQTFANAVRKRSNRVREVPLEEGAPFPALSTFAAATQSTQPVESARGTRRDLQVRRLDGIEEASAALIAAAREGLCAVWVRNAVQDVFDGRDVLRALAPDLQIDVFHARFAACDRRTREKDVLSRFGKQSTPDMRAGRILVASQVVEQSLDLDFDVMVSDLAPIDLLIQRSGRLQRHDHRPLRPAPELMVLGPSASDDAAASWLGPDLRRAGFVYLNHGDLWRTMKEIETHGLKLKSRCPRAPLEAVYGADAPKTPSGLTYKESSAEGKALADRAHAANHFLGRDARFVQNAGLWEPEAHTPTRLGEKTITLRLCRWEGAALRPWANDADMCRAWRLSELSVRPYQAAEVVGLDPACALAAAALDAAEAKAFDAPLHVPLTSDDACGWRAEVVGAVSQSGAPGRRSTLIYTPGEGARFVAYEGSPPKRG